MSLRYHFAFGSDITPYIKIDKVLMAYMFSKVMYFNDLHYNVAYLMIKRNILTQNNVISK